MSVVICSKFITFAVTKTTERKVGETALCCDLLKIHYLCGNKDNPSPKECDQADVVICSKFITFAVTKTTARYAHTRAHGCDLLKIHYLCGNKDNLNPRSLFMDGVVICSKFITFAVTKTTLIWYLAENQRNVECVRNKKRCCLKRRTHC